MPPPTPSDPTQRSRWGPLFRLLRELDTEIERIYEQAGFSGFRARFAKPLVRLHHGGPMSIKDLAAECGVTHSAMSQTVAAMRASGFVATTPSPDDARARSVVLTEEARPLVALAEAEWAATEAALAELESEVPYPMSRLVQDIDDALSRRGFGDRVRSHLPTDPQDRPGGRGGNG